MNPITLLSPATGNILIAPSLLSADMARLADAIEAVRAEADYIHCDVMDGHFVPNLTFGAPVVKAVKAASQSIPLDVHLMIEDPDRWVDDYLKAGLDGDDYLTIHIEAARDARQTLLRIRNAGVKAGISLKPATSPDAILDLLPLLDQVLIMTVEPGFGGQSFMGDMLPKIGQIKSMPEFRGIVGVDGGIDATTAPLAARAGADLLVAGSAIYGKPNPAEAAWAIRQAAVG